MQDQLSKNLAWCDHNGVVLLPQAQQAQNQQPGAQQHERGGFRNGAHADTDIHAHVGIIGVPAIGILVIEAIGSPQGQDAAVGIKWVGVAARGWVSGAIAADVARHKTNGGID